ncbi:MAG: 2-amino-4-hydroxy-6-hydroxymethyldihydropteridine diphosphokinase [Porphyromonadaceae bacterium CG2_30_38_12]|nr:MAG: 2-amino-4-hydroxy-6-hydroxymethyldihydropteridine diphosphokinase [Porphyromonadaceae bacterium CG2_30_38_12]
MHKIYISIGSNLGNKEQNIVNAIAEIGCQIGLVKKVSSFYNSEPWGFESKNEFVNAVILVLCDTPPLLLLQKTQAIEKKLGREPKTNIGYSDRIIDIDILLYDKVVVDLPNLQIPHPLMLQRNFVMEPLREIASDLAIFSGK